MCYCEYYCNHRHHSLVVKTQNETSMKQGSLPVQQKSRQLCVALESLQIPQLLHLWNDPLIFILVFSLARSSSLFLHCFSSSVFLSLLFDVGNSGACLSLSLSLSDQVRADTAPVGGRGTASMEENDWHFSDTPLGSDWLCWSWRGGFLQIKLQPLGGATDSWPVPYSTVRSWWQV